MRSYILVVCTLFFLFSSDCYAKSAQEWIEIGYSSENVDQAIASFTKAIEIDPNNMHAYHLRGMAKREKGDLDGALSDYNKAIELSPHYVDAYIGRAKTKKRLGDETGAEEDFQKAEELRKAGKNYLLDDPDFKRRMRAKDPDAILKKAYYDLWTVGNYKSAVENFDKYLSIVKTPNNSKIYYDKAYALQKLGDLEGAIDTYSTCLQVFPADANTYKRRAGLKEKIGDHDGAASDMSKVEELVRKRRLDEIEELSARIADNPEDGYSYLRRAELFDELGNYEAALADLAEAKKYLPNTEAAVWLEDAIKQKLEEKIE